MDRWRDIADGGSRRGVALFAGRSGEDAATVKGVVSTTASATTDSVLRVVHVHKSPTCGCCSKWVEHMREQGFQVRTTDTQDLTQFKRNHGVPAALESCHTALVAGYVLEGHVPAADIKRLLEERPALAGLAVAGMPIGSPGMEVPGTAAQPYEVIAFRNDGRTDVFAKHGS